MFSWTVHANGITGSTRRDACSTCLQRASRLPAIPPRISNAALLLCRNSFIRTIVRVVLDYLEHRVRSSGDEPVALEFRIVDRSGTVRWISHLSRSIHSDSGEFLGYRASNRDITERKRYEAMWKEREARYRQVVEDQTDPICRFKPSGVLTFVNSAFCNYFHENPRALIGRHFCSFIPDKHVQEVRSRIKSITLDVPVFKCEYEITVRPGELRWINWTLRGVFDAEGTLMEIQSVARDTTDRKRAELALKESEERYANLVGSIPDGVVVYDPEGRATYVNEGFSQMYGWTQEDVLGRSIGFVPEQEQEEDACRVATDV